jgi:DNA sulfur modification protein DndD
MKLLNIELENFGPYYGRQIIDLETTTRAHIILIHGENMRGKTTLLNAIKWCLYGKVTTQVAHQVLSDDGFASYVARDNGGEFVVGVTLAVEHGSERLQLTREFKCERNEALPDEVVITRSPKFRVLSDTRGVISTDEAGDLISAMLPEDLSGLFFFDGESLGELQRSVESSSGSAILRNRIERILGMPAFTESISIVDSLRKDVSKSIQAMNKVSKQQEESSAQLKESEDELTELKGQRQGVISFLDDARRKISELEPKFRANALLIENEKRYEDAKLDRDEIRDRIAVIKAEMRELLDGGFWMPLSPKIEALKDSLIDEIQGIQAESANEEAWLNPVRVQRMHEVGVCDTCDHALTTDDLRRLDEKAKISGDAVRQAVPVAVQELISRQNRVRSFRNASARIERLKDLDQDFQEAIARREFKERQVADFKRMLDESGESGDSIEKAYLDAKLSQEEGEVTLQRLDDRIKVLETEIRTLEGSISENVDDPHLRAQGKLLVEVGDILEHGLGSFESLIREQVMEQASEIFRRLTTEEKYRGLRIDNDYNLKIVDDDDRIITKRSAGAEQIVAMALVGALSNCAVNDAPVLIDTPFGRLDATHRRNVVRWLPELADQVVLFVTSGEFDEDVHRALLDDEIAAEYDLVPESHIQTTVRSR